MPVSDPVAAKKALKAQQQQQSQDQQGAPSSTDTLKASDAISALNPDKIEQYDNNLLGEAIQLVNQQDDTEVPDKKEDAKLSESKTDFNTDVTGEIKVANEASAA